MHQAVKHGFEVLNHKPNLMHALFFGRSSQETTAPVKNEQKVMQHVDVDVGVVSSPALRSHELLETH